MTMISPYEMKPSGRSTPLRKSARKHADRDDLAGFAKAVFNHAYMICALPLSVLNWPLAQRRRRLTGQRQPFLIRSPFDETGFAIEPPKTASQVERLAYLAAKLERDNAKANHHTVRELKELIRDLHEEGAR